MNEFVHWPENRWASAVVGAYGWLDTFCELLERGPDSAPDFITLDGAEGGTGAAPLPLMDVMGLPLHESLPLVIDTLKRHGLRERIKVIASGKLDARGRRMGVLHGCGFRHFGARLHVRTGLYPGLAMQQEHLPYRNHHAQRETAERAGRGGQIPAVMHYRRP